MQTHTDHTLQICCSFISFARDQMVSLTTNNRLLLVVSFLPCTKRVITSHRITRYVITDVKSLVQMPIEWVSRQPQNKQTNKKKKVQKWCTKTIVSFFFFFKKTPHLSWKWAYFTPLELNIWAFIIIYCIQTISGSLLTWHRTFNRIRLLASRSKNDKSFDIIPIQSWILLYLDRAHWKKYIHWIY